MLASRWQDCTDPNNAECVSLYQSYQAQLASDRWYNWLETWNGSFPLAAWGYFHRYGESQSEFDVYKNANLTMAVVPPVMDPNALQAGLRTITSPWNMDDERVYIYRNLELLNEYMNYPSSGYDNVTGYFIKDEPHDLSTYKQLGIAHNIIYVDDDTSRLPIVNLLPYPYSDDYKNYVDEYINYAHPSVLISTCYVLSSYGTDNDARFYNNYEILREKSLQNNIGMFCFVLCTEHLDYRESSESDVYWQAYALLAYGAKGIFYYNYRISDIGFGDGLVTSSSGTPTAKYYYVQSVNSEILNLADILMNLESKGVYHAGGVSATETQSYTQGAIAGISNLSSGEFIISEFRNSNSQDDDVYIMIVNKKHGAGLAKNAADLVQSCSFSVNSNYGYVYQYDNSNGNLNLLTSNDGTYTISLTAGGTVIRLSSDME